jgi:hypothetical protein
LPRFSLAMIGCLLVLLGTAHSASASITVSYMYNYYPDDGTSSIQRWAGDDTYDWPCSASKCGKGLRIIGGKLYMKRPFNLPFVNGFYGYSARDHSALVAKTWRGTTRLLVKKRSRDSKGDFTSPLLYAYQTLNAATLKLRRPSDCGQQEPQSHCRLRHK